MCSLCFYFICSVYNNIPVQVPVFWQVSSLTNYQIKNIKEGVNYTIWVIASNEKGSSQPLNKKWVLVKSECLLFVT